MISKEELKELLAEFEGSSLSALELEELEGGWRVRLEKNSAGEIVRSDIPGARDLKTEEKKEMPESPSSSAFVQVKAPLVGVFYEAPSPGEAPFVKPGDKVNEGDTLCLIEAMKMINELKSPVSGTIKRIYCENESLVEFDQTIFEVEPC